MATKPRIKYVSNKRPIELDDNLSIVKKSNGVKWNNKTELTNYIDSLYVHPNSDTYLYVECHCGETYTYANKSNVPSSSVTCSCSRKIIEYSS